MSAYLVLEGGDLFKGNWRCGKPSAGEVIFNTAHGGYEEIATDPSYYGQIIVMTAPQQGNYGVNRSFWESRQLWIRGFIALDIQRSEKNSNWLERLEEFSIPAIDGIDTRSLVLFLREKGTQIGAMLEASSEKEARKTAAFLIDQFKKEDKDWVFKVSSKEMWDIEGKSKKGPEVAVLDFGCKENTLRELSKRSKKIRIFPARTPLDEILKWNPHGVLLSNGPGDPENVQMAVETIAGLLEKKPVFGICMGHQLLGLALGGETFRLKFGHHGINHPVRDVQKNKIYMTSQNHGYAVKKDSLPENILVTHINLNDQTVSGIKSEIHNCFSVQFHPESHPGPRDGVEIFDQFFEMLNQESEFE